MYTSAAGRAAIMSREGCRLEAYLDSTGVPTIGVGHTGRASPPAVHMGDTITKVTAGLYLANDLVEFERAVNGCIVKPISQNAYDAMVSLAFNIGAPSFASSTVARSVRAGNMAAAADAFLLWNKPAELITRRKAERAQFLRPDGPIASVAAPASWWSRVLAFFGFGAAA